MRKLLLAVDKLSTFVGRAFAWLIVFLTCLVTWEVLSRRFLDAPHAWVFDAQIMAYGVLFMMAGAYTLSANGHVRGDVLYGFFPPRVQAALDLVLYLAFFIPGTVALVWAGIRFAGESWAIGEHSSIMAEGPPIYPFKTFIRCLICLKNGAWPSRQQDVEEVDVDKLKEMVNVSDEDIAALDEVVVKKAEEAK
jgi:TRAP-type mannitol/chloroaromatic compound transport system permease small subunit